MKEKEKKNLFQSFAFLFVITGCILWWGLSAPDTPGGIFEAQNYVWNGTGWNEWAASNNNQGKITIYTSGGTEFQHNNGRQKIQGYANPSDNDNFDFGALLETQCIPMLYNGNRYDMGRTISSGASDKAQQVGITDGTSIAAIDSDSDSLQIIEYEHHEIHEGNHYFYYNYTDIPASSSHDLILITPVTTPDIHIVIRVDIELESTIKFYENASISDTGVDVDEQNSNRQSTNFAYLDIFDAPTISALGNEIAAARVGSGKSFGGSTRSESEFILLPDTIYLIRTTNHGTGSASLTNYAITWYENGEFVQPD